MKTLLKLMDVKTLVAGIIPVVFGSVFSLYKYNAFNLLDMIILMIGIILLQSCANMINDLFDYKRGADGTDKSHEKALASGEISYQNVKKIVMSFIVIDLMIATYYSVTVHYSIMIVSLVGGLVMYLYSAGKRPISYTPFGELVAGSTMGFGIMTTVIYIQSGVFNLETIGVVIPTALYIGTILLTNNISDYIEDELNGRRTLPIIIGIKKAESLWLLNCYLILTATFLLVLFKILPIEGLLVATIILPHKKIMAFKDIKKVAKNKGEMMGLIGSVGLKYHLAIIVGLLAAKYITK